MRYSEFRENSIQKISNTSPIDHHQDPKDLGVDESSDEDSSYSEDEDKQDQRGAALNPRAAYWGQAYAKLMKSGLSSS